MGAIAKKPYEISIWEDVLEKVEKTDDSTGYVTIEQYYKENKLAVIGSDTMTSPARAHNPILTKNINGSSNLTFTMYSRYFDETQEERVDNPFLGLLVNERKVKLKYDGEWYDFVIKRIDENSENNTFSYTAKNLFINELSKTGFSIELDTELENNQGTVVDIAKTILEESDWQVDEAACDIIQQRNEEPLYEIATNKEITGYNMNNEEETITIPSNSIIYGFYSSISEEKPFFQFLYRADGAYAIDDDRVITNSEDWYIDGVVYINNSGFPSPDFARYCSFSDQYRGKRLVRKEKTLYDPKTDKYVSLYADSTGKDVYGFTVTEYISPTILKNLLTNSENFVSTNGWQAEENCTVEDAVYPPINNITDVINTEFMSLLKVSFFNRYSYIYNSGISDNKANIGEFSTGDQYVFRVKHGYSGSKDSRPGIIPNNEGLRAKVAEYTLEDGQYELGTTYIDFTGDFTSELASSDNDLPYQYIVGTCQNSISYNDLITKRIGFFIYAPTNPSLYYSIQDIQFFPYKTDANGAMVIPGAAPEAIIKTIYYYYYPTEKYTSLEDVSFIYKGYEPSPLYTSQYDNSYQKIRSITATESNRFNMIQDLCETFECWADFRIEHDPDTGEILMDENHRQKKWISFKNYIGTENYSGFRYGINLDSITRNIDSEAIVSKIIVKQNSNQYATDGFCTIARAKDNPIKENFLYNFKHYIQQGLLDYTQVSNDLYLDAGGYLGYYVKLRNLNKDRDSYIEQQSEIENTITNLEAQVQTYEVAAQEAEASLTTNKNELKAYTGFAYEDFTSNNSEAAKWLVNDKVREYITAIKTLSGQTDRFNALWSQAEANLQEYQGKLENIENYLDSIAEQKNELNKIFYKKYSRFIQEGSWISEDYIDDNLYYLDAEALLYTSASPQISYTINVLEISEMPGFENYHFALGDITYMEDTEFFGWVVKNGMKTPYKEEIVISEISYSLDSPESNKITVQNYKTQFEDLFQRITATTQSIEYKSGEYGKVSDIINTNGEIKVQTLQNSFANNSLIISNAKDQSVVWNDNGMIITSLSKPNEIVRLISGGIFLSANGGDTWNAGITGNGINANHITSGQIDASRIHILSGSFSAFRWDERGINAYRFTRNDQGEAEFFNFGEFVRFDQYGIYGMRGDQDFTPESEEEIRNNADFGFTWDGFFLKSNYGNVAPNEQGYITIDSENDIQVIDGQGTERIKIGRLGQDLFGIRFSDSDGAPVMVTDDDGQLFLKQKLFIGPDISDTYRYRAQIGVIESYTEDGEVTTDDSLKDYSKIFSVKDQENIETVAIYDNGLLKADRVELTGIIYATGGKIGNMTIEDINNIGQIGKNVTIQSLEGEFFKLKDGVASPESLTLTARLSNVQVAGDTAYTWSGSNDFDQWETLSGSGSQYIFNYEAHKDKFNTNGTYFIRLVVAGTDGENYTSYLTINTVADGAQGKPGESGEQTYIHIKYSAYPDGTDFSDTPNTYMGIYTGPSETAPTDKSAYTWNKVQGEDGSAVSQKRYIVNINQDRILKFKEIESETQEITTAFSPSQLIISLSLHYEDTNLNLNFDQYDASFEVYDSTVSEWISMNDYIGYYIIQDTIENENRYIFNIQDYCSAINEIEDKNWQRIRDIIRTQETVIRFKALIPDTNQILVIAPIEIRFGSTEDMAFFELNAAGINAAIQNTKLEFNVDGLTIQNGGLSILNNNEERVLYADDNGDLIIEGTIYANSGTFNGTVNATDGTFNGTVNATNGTLGNLNIDGQLLVGNIIIDGRDTIEQIDSSNYIFSEDTSINFEKSYYTLSGEEYIQVDFSVLINPSLNNYYEFDGENYTLSQDTTLDINKNYYILQNEEYVSVNLNNLVNPSTSNWYENPIIEIQNQYQGIYINNYTSDSDSGFFISSSGEIVANTIVLGNHATIKNYIQLGNNTWIFNPSSINSVDIELIENNKIPSNAFLLINQINSSNELENTFAVTSDGILRLGSTTTGIILNGVTESIQSANYTTSTGWNINSDSATFNNIIARGSIKSSVLEYSNIQAVGGILIIRPSSIIKTVKKEESGNVFITIENRNGFSTGDYCKIGYGNALIEDMFEIRLANGASEINDIDGSLNGEDGAEIELLNTNNLQTYDFVGLPFVNFGRTGDIGIGINSSANNNLIVGNALSLFELQIQNEETLSTENNVQLVPKVILGQIPNIPESYGSLAGRYGLYADNVLLKGSMIANGINYSSGINTESEAMEKNSNFPADRRGNILLWAGADSDSVEDIENARFRVDTYGNLYAGSGYFQGTIITDATITAAEIKTATITGYAKDNEGNYSNAALNIRDTSYGINFTNNGIQRMSLTDQGLTLNSNLQVGSNFIVRNDSTVIMPIALIYNQIENVNNLLAIQPDKIGFIINGLPSTISGLDYKMYLNYNNGINIIDSTTTDIITATFNKNQSRFNTDVQFNNNLLLQNIIEYRAIRGENNQLIGYDLYVQE